MGLFWLISSIICPTFSVKMDTFQRKHQRNFCRNSTSHQTDQTQNLQVTKKPSSVFTNMPTQCCEKKRPAYLISIFSSMILRIMTSSSCFSSSCKRSQHNNISNGNTLQTGRQQIPDNWSDETEIAPPANVHNTTTSAMATLCRLAGSKFQTIGVMKLK